MASLPTMEDVEKYFEFKKAQGDLDTFVDKGDTVRVMNLGNGSNSTMSKIEFLERTRHLMDMDGYRYE